MVQHGGVGARGLGGDDGLDHRVVLGVRAGQAPGRAELGAPEIQLVLAQDEIIAPSQLFDARRLAP